MQSAFLILRTVFIRLCKPVVKGSDLIGEVYLRAASLIKHPINLLAGMFVPEESICVELLLPELVIKAVLSCYRFDASPLSLDKLYYLLCLVDFPHDSLVDRVILQVLQ